MYIEGDVPVVTTTNGNNGGWGGFMNGDGIWAIILFAMIFGYGRNGFGGFGSGYGGSGVGENYILATDMASLERKLDGVNSGICDSTFALNNTITNGFFGVQNSLTQGFSGLNTALLQGNYALSSQFADCCCKTQRAIDGVNYNMATQFGGLNNTLCNLGRDIIENQNANYRAIHEELVANKLEAKNDRIAEQQAYINKLELKASQAAQNAYLLNELKPCPSAAYIVPNPNCCYNYNVTGVGYGTTSNCCC